MPIFSQGNVAWKLIATDMCRISKSGVVETFVWSLYYIRQNVMIKSLQKSLKPKKLLIDSKLLDNQIKNITFYLIEPLYREY